MSPNRSFCIFVSLAIILLVPLAPAKPQDSASGVEGRILDPSGAVVVGAKVLLWQPATAVQHTALTDASGAFRIAGLVEGSYRASVRAEGFLPLFIQVQLPPGRVLTVEWTLQVQPVREQVVVEAPRLVSPVDPLGSVPGSYDVLEGAALELSRSFNTTEALRKVPGLNVRDEEGFGLRPNIGIRGLNPTRSTKVLLLEDGIPLAFAPYGDNASYYHPPLDRFESVEVLKGSGQILYGPSTVGGVINYLTPPIPERRSGWLTLVGGNRDYLNAHLRHGWRFSEGGLLLDVMRKQGRGSRENVRSGLTDVNFKGELDVSSKQIWVIRANYYDEDSNVTYSGLREDEFVANPRQNPFRNDFFRGKRFGASATHLYVFSSDLLLRTNLYTNIFDRNWWRQSSNSNQRPNDAADPNCGGMANLNTTCGNEGRLRTYYTWGVEPRFQAHSRWGQLAADSDFGLRVHYELQDRIQENGPLPTSRSGVRVEDNERQNLAIAGFYQLRMATRRWALTPGLRIEHVRYERTNRLTGAQGRTDLTQLIPGIAVAYHVAERATFFFGVHRGFAPPRTEDIVTNTGGTVDLDPELSWNYEVGFRSAPYRGVRLEATFFRMDYENQIVPASVAGGLGATFTNGGETLHQGVEFAARLDLGALAGSRHNVYTRMAYTYLPIAKFVGTRFSSIPGFTTVSVSGNRLPYAPEHGLNFQVGYAHPRGLDAFLEAVHSSAQFGDDLNTIVGTPDGQRGLLPGWTVWNATVNYSSEPLRAVFFVSVKNLFDRLYIADRTRGLLPGPPRLIQGGIKYRF
jgi:Fe(3+) dicitrate transport protein